ncbi:dUTP diphosphatase [Ruania suaedae]|uniref:dUTP diphosphatase n=1 Tax=Ruania suaedae TaxID=2897774 RepID=UPI001E513D84|nr:dUTP diphosphatase [Ruania suaedae]UFU04641.1 dUTP diphosphatase [Ruania suaedae]
MPVEVLLQRLDAELTPPGYARPGDAGLDLQARESAQIPPGGRHAMPTGIALALPAGYAAFVHPRSGLAARHGLTVLNAPGTIDAGYRGEITVILHNTDPTLAVEIDRGDRIAQLVIQRVAVADLIEVEVLPASERGSGGLGSTGGVVAMEGQN